MKRLWAFIFFQLFAQNCFAQTEKNSPEPKYDIAPPNCSSKSLGISRTLSISKLKQQNFGDFDFDSLPLKPYEVVLTFDDGPQIDTTPRVLNALNKQCTNGVFFQLGQQIEEAPNLANLLAQYGNLVGLHSYSHLSMQKLPIGEQIADFEKTKTIAQAHLKANLVPIYRFPFLETTDELTQYLNNGGYHVVSVDIDSYDWADGATLDSVFNKIFSQLAMHHHNGIILLHDGEPLEAKILPELLDALKIKGYKIVRLEK